MTQPIPAEHITPENISMFQDPYFWIVLSTIIFVVLAFKKGREPFLKMLDSRTDRIQNELNEAENLRIEAQELLAEYKRKQRDAVQTAENIIQQAEEQAVIIKKDTEQKIDDSLKRKEMQLLERIERAEFSAIQEIREQAADLATAAAEKLIIHEMKKNSAKLINASITDLPKELSA